MEKELADLKTLFTGPSYDDLKDLKENKEKSLLRVVESKTPGELGRMVVGELAYETIMGCPEERNMLVRAMDMMKKRQASMNDDRLYRKLNEVCPTRQLAPNKWQYIMKPVDMKWFFFHVPFFALPRKIFEKFAIPVKNFLTTQLFRFYVNKLLFKKPPTFPEDADLPEIFNAFGPNNRRKRKAGFPDLAAIKQDMVHRVTHFAVMYCVHWVVEMLTLRNVNGMVKYAYPALDVLGKMVKIQCSPPRDNGREQPPPDGRQSRDGSLPPHTAEARDEAAYHHSELPSRVSKPRQESSQHERYDQMPSRQEFRHEQPQQEPWQQGPSRGEQRQQEPRRHEPWRREPPRQERWQEEPRREERPPYESPRRERWEEWEVEPRREERSPYELSRQELWEKWEEEPRREERPPYKSPRRERWEEWEVEPRREERSPYEPSRQERWEKWDEEPRREERPPYKSPRRERWEESEEEPRRDERPPYESPRRERRQEEPRREEPAPFVHEPRPLSAEADHLLDESDDWSEMLRMAQSDPKLPMHYKAMIGCLISSNRDLSNILESLKSRGNR